VDKYSLDTNILIYSVDDANTEKFLRASELLRSLAIKPVVLTLQSLAEFYCATTRKGLLPHRTALEQIEDWIEIYPVTASHPRTLDLAAHATHEHQMQFWDAMLWATAKEAGVTVLFSEDFQHGQAMGGVRFCNPFLENNHF
jgi:predicted nucleic acid-binding protein